MAPQSIELVELARSVSERLAGGSLSPASAKLYSQHTRLEAGQAQLRNWRPDEASVRLEEAVRLIEAGFVQRAADDQSWSIPVLRAAELLEWLSHPELNSEELPLHLMSAAAYQLAGYPARAAGLLNAEPAEFDRDGPIQAFLRGDFPNLLSQLTGHWVTKPRAPNSTPAVNWADESDTNAQLRNLVENEMVSALGVLSAELRWGSQDRVELAVSKLDSIAKVMLDGRDPYSWLLSKLVAETARTIIAASLRSGLAWMPAKFNSAGKLAVERYLRQAYQSNKTQVWPSQQRGIDRLATGGSFVLSTPTGSGKTTVAEIAILQRLFSPQQEIEIDVAPLVMYLVPSRALAAEVEQKLLRTIAPLSLDQIVITGLYGGIDWGPTDAWLTSDDRTVLICTYEKAEALIRFLGPLFLGRLSLVVLDEAHMVQFDDNAGGLQSGENRPLRLESLISRLLTHIPEERSQVIALSAVATGMETPLAKWITGGKSAFPEKNRYRSTRQLIGRLQCKAERSFEIRYDLLDRASLKFDETDEGGTPFIPKPFPPHPPTLIFEPTGLRKPLGPEKRLRPYLFWAAMHLVAPANSKRRHAVLVSIPQQINGYVEDLLNLIDKDWADQTLPLVFEPPTDLEKYEKWQRCLRACEDYFGAKSGEYRLLKKGIVAHHGKMPGLMARLLIQLVDNGIVHLVLATSSLSEGVNLPFEVVLLPTLRRGQKDFTAREFANLAGRAGRPGYGTEGKCLVLLNDSSNDWSSRQMTSKYESLVEQLAVKQDADNSSTGGRSALAELLDAIWTGWQAVAASNNKSDFFKWLEVTATLELSVEEANEVALIESLDSLDSVLLASVVEIESLTMTALSASELEKRLANIWRHSYAHFASQQETKLGEWFVHRGVALATQIYPNADERRRLYRSGLPPRLGDQLSKLYPSIQQFMIDGTDYASRDADGRFDFMKNLVELLAAHPRFSLDEKTPGKAPWEKILRWWLDPKGPISNPGAKKVSGWYNYISNNFNYRFAWGIGCILALAANEAHEGELKPTTLDRWDDLGLPWIALWLKDMMVWGTLDPVVAYVLGRGRAGTRSEAAELATQYYEIHLSLDPDDLLNPKTIRKWLDRFANSTTATLQSKPGPAFEVKLERTFPQSASRQWRVLPAVSGNAIKLIDCAGYLLASGELPPNWAPCFLDEGDFFLNVDTCIVTYQPYL